MLFRSASTGDEALFQCTKPSGVPRGPSHLQTFVLLVSPVKNTLSLVIKWFAPLFLLRFDKIPHSQGGFPDYSKYNASSISSCFLFHCSPYYITHYVFYLNIFTVYMSVLQASHRFVLFMVVTLYLNC